MTLSKVALVGVFEIAPTPQSVAWPGMRVKFPSEQARAEVPPLPTHRVPV
jgi:hypothetical protein